MAKRSKKKQGARDIDVASDRGAAVASTRYSLRKFVAYSWLPLLLALITFAVYWPSLSSDFVSDARLEIDEGYVTSLSNLPSVFSLKALGMQLMLSDRPGEMIYLMLNSALWGKQPFGFHLMSNLLHAANVALLFVLMRCLLAEELIGWTRTHFLKVQLAMAAATLIFALHPIMTESVSEVSFSSNLLVTFFTLLALLAATAFRADERKTAIIAGTAGLLCVFAAVLAKESGLTAALLLIAYWFLFRRREAKGPWLVFLGASMALTVAVLATILLFAVSRQLQLNYLGGSFSQVFLIQPQLWVFMMAQLLWPTHLSADYVLQDMNLPSTPVACVLLFIVLALQVWLVLRSRIGALGVAAYWLGLSTVSNFVPLFCVLADRFYYLPLAGVAMQLVALLVLTMRSRWRYELALAGCTVALVPLTFLTISRQAVFANELSLCEETLKLSPDSSLMHNSLALAFFRQGQIEQASAEYEKALAVDPVNSCAHISLGIIALRQGRPDEAIGRFQKAIEINPKDNDAHCSLGVALCQTGRLDEGMDELRQALAIDPGDVTAHHNLGLALLQQGQTDAAIAQFQTALEMSPGSTHIHYDLGNALARKGEWDHAIAQYHKVLDDAPGDFEALTNLGVALAHKGLFDDAITQYNQALKIHPDSADVHNNLGVALIQNGQVDDAISQFQEALRLKPDYSAAQTDLMRAMAQKNGVGK